MAKLLYMKKYFLGLLVMSMLTFWGCSKSFLDETPKGSLVPQNFYKTSNDLTIACSGIAYQMGACFSLVTPTYFGADDITAKRTGNKIVFSDYDVFVDNNTKASNARMSAYFWNPLYATIKQANALIANYKNAKEATIAQQNNAGGYAYFIRATCYFYLTRTFGNIPMPLLVSTDSLQNSTVESIYTQIVSDLKNAETMLPNHWTGNQQQNGIDILPTAGSAKAMLAEVYLTMAGWPLKQTDKYALAAQKAKEVIDNKASWGYDLLPNYGDLWQIGNKFNKEAIFACYYNNQAPNTGFYNGTEMGPPSLAPAEEGGWDDLFGEITFFKNFPEGPRKAATYQYQYFPNNNPALATDWEHDVQKHPYFLKYRDDVSYNWTTHKSNNWWGSATSYLLRYSNVLLTYAEAEAMSAGPDASAYAALNLIRARAAGHLNDLKAGLSQTAFRDSVVAERGWEYAAEFGSRWYDLLRTETVAKVNSTRDAGEVPLTNQPDDANHAYYLSPIPITQ
jgi:hypothetical protein